MIEIWSNMPTMMLTFIFHSYLNSRATPKQFFSMLSPSTVLTLWFAGTVTSTIWLFLLSKFKEIRVVDTDAKIHKYLILYLLDSFLFVLISFYIFSKKGCLQLFLFHSLRVFYVSSDWGFFSASCIKSPRLF